MQAHDSRQWTIAMQDELKSLLEVHKVAKWVKYEPGMKVYKCKPVFKRKRDHEGNVVRHKVRYTIAAYTKTMIQGIDYKEKHAQTAMWGTVTLIIWIAVQHDWPIWLIDIKTFFLYGVLPEDEVVYMEPFPGMKHRENHVLQLVKAVYGLPSAAHHAQQKLHHTLTKDGLFKQSIYDPCLYVLIQGKARFFLATHVDDGPCTGNSAGYKLAVECLKSVFEITVTKEPKMILGVQIDRDFNTKTIKLHQTTYVKSMLSKFGLERCKERATPMEKNAAGIIHKKLREAKERGAQGKEEDLQQRMGTLIYLKTRPDIAFANTFVARFSTSAGTEEVKMANDIMRYLAKFPSGGLQLKASNTPQMVWYADADLAGDPVTAKSTGGVIGQDGSGNTFFYRSWLQRKVSDSTGMAETYAAHEACRLIQLFVGLWKEVGLQIKLPVKLHVDSENVFKLSKGITNHHASRHYRIAQAFIAEKVKDGLVELVYIRTDKNPADLLTKALSREVHDRHAQRVMVMK